MVAIINSFRSLKIFNEIPNSKSSKRHNKKEKIRRLRRIIHWQNLTFLHPSILVHFLVVGVINLFMSANSMKDYMIVWMLLVNNDDIFCSSWEEMKWSINFQISIQLMVVVISFKRRIIFIFEKLNYFFIFLDATSSSPLYCSLMSNVNEMCSETWRTVRLAS